MARTCDVDRAEGQERSAAGRGLLRQALVGERRLVVWRERLRQLAHAVVIGEVSRWGRGRRTENKDEDGNI